MLSKVLTLSSFVLISSIFSTQLAFAGDSRGGGNTDKNNMRALKHLFESDAYYLKLSMLNYLETLIPEQIPEKVETDIITKNFFSKVGKDKFKKDIQASRYVLAKNCFEKNNPSITAQAGIGDLTGQICFDLNKFYKQNKSRTPEERLIQLASLAFHEEVHHFQDGTIKIEDNESEAYAVSAYVLNTAIFAQVPVLKWSDPRTFVGEIKKEGFSGDRAKGLLNQLRKTGGHSEGQNNIAAENIKCERADIMLINIKSPINQQGQPNIIPWPWVGCSANPNISPSALEGFVGYAEGFLGMSNSGFTVVDVRDRVIFDAMRLSCIDNGDRCEMDYREPK